MEKIKKIFLYILLAFVILTFSLISIPCLITAYIVRKYTLNQVLESMEIKTDMDIDDIENDNELNVRV